MPIVERADRNCCTADFTLQPAIDFSCQSGTDRGQHDSIPSAISTGNADGSIDCRDGEETSSQLVEMFE